MRTLAILLFIIISAQFSFSQGNIDSLKLIANQTPADTNRIKLQLEITKLYVNNNSDSALKYGLMAYNLADNLGQAHKKATAANALGIIYMNKALYQTALAYYTESALLMHDTKDFRAESFVYNNMGSVYFHLKSYADALTYYNRSLELKKQLNLDKETSSTYINIGNIYMQMDNYDSCFHFYNQALNNARVYTDNHNISLALMNLGEISFMAKDFDKALFYYNNALQHTETTGKNISFVANCHYSIGKIYTETGKYEEAKSMLLKAQKIAEPSGFKSLQINIYKHLAHLYENMEEYEEAYSYFTRFHALHDSIFNRENMERITLLRKDYEDMLKDKQISELSEEKALAENRAEREQLVRNIFILAFLFIGVISLVLFRNITLKKRSNNLLVERQRLIEQHQTEIESKNEELKLANTDLQKENILARYEILKAQINPHFLFNSLTTLSNLIITDQKKALVFVSQFARFYRDILETDVAKLHTLKEEVNIAKRYIQLQKIRFGRNIKVKWNVEPQYFAFVLPPFSVQILLENAIKHNVISSDDPLTITVETGNNEIIVRNNYQKKAGKGTSIGSGQRNISERFKAFTTTQPHFEIKNGFYIAALPLILHLQQSKTDSLMLTSYK